MPDITKGYTFSDSKADWASDADTALRLNKMVDDAKVNLVAGSNISISRGSNGITISSTGGGTGTVTNVSVVSANGVSGTVANSTTTPAITLALGAITPTSVAATGTVGGSNLSGTNTGDQTITLTSDVTGSGTGSFATTIANGVVTNAKLANVATATFKGRTTAGTGSPEDLTAAQATALLNTFNSTTKGLVGPSGGGTTNFLRADGTWATPSGGTGTVTSVSVVSANGVSGTVANPTTTPAITLSLGAITPTSVASTGTVTGTNLSGTNTGDQTITLTSDVTGSGTGSFATTIAAGVVTNAKLANVATATFKGRTSAGTGSPEDLTATQATALLNTFTSSLKGLAPSSGGGTANFLRADGTWANPGTGAPIATTGPIYSRLVKTIAGTITAGTDTKWSFPELYNVRDYGATGDGTTDDTTAIQAAITAACAKQYGGPYTQTSPKGVVYFPAGKYAISSALTITAGFMGWLRIFGDGPRNSIIFQTADGQNCLQSIQTINNTSFDHQTINIADLGFEVGEGITCPYAIRIVDGKYNRFENITINCFSNVAKRIKTGISNEHAWYAFFSNIEYMGCNTNYDVVDATNPTAAIYVKNSTNVVMNNISSVWATNGIVLEGAGANEHYVFQGFEISNVNIIQSLIGINLIGSSEYPDANGQMSIVNYLFDAGTSSSFPQTKAIGIKCLNVKELHLSNYQALCNATVGVSPESCAISFNNTYRCHIYGATVVTGVSGQTGIKCTNGSSDNTFSDIRFDGFSTVINCDSTSNYNYIFSSRYGYAGNTTWNVTDYGTGNVLNRMG